MNVAAATNDETLPVSKIRTDGGTQPRAAIYQNVIDDYAEALASGATFPPVVVFYDGSDYWLADGFHRHAGHKKAGRDNIAADIRQGTRRDAVLYSVGANSQHGLRRTNEDKRRAVTTLLQDSEWAAWSDNQISKKACVSQPFVSSLRSSLITVISEPRTYTTKHGTVATMSTANIGRPVQAAAPIIRASSEPLHVDAVPDAIEPANDNNPHVRGTFGTGENEWYTPADHITMAREVLGGIDLDPASSEIANKVVGAAKFYTQADNGLDKQWGGNVWMNPPYAQPAITHFAEKMASEWEADNINAAIALTHNYTDTSWFHRMASVASAICFTRGRVKFESPTGEKAAPTQGQAFFYFGNDIGKFKEVFSRIGFVTEVLK